MEGRIEPKEANLRTLFDASDGIARDPMADFDGAEIYFAYRPDGVIQRGGDPYWHLMAVNADGSGVEQTHTRPFPRLLPMPAARTADSPLFRPAVVRGSFAGVRRPSCCSAWTATRSGRCRMPTSANGRPRHARRPPVVDSIRVHRQGRRLRPHAVGHPPRREHPELVFGNNTPNCYINGREVPARARSCARSSRTAAIITGRWD